MRVANPGRGSYETVLPESHSTVCQRVSMGICVRQRPSDEVSVTTDFKSNLKS